MKLIIGGYAQGKLNYVLEKYGAEASKIFDGEIPENIEEKRGIVVINHFHNWVKMKIAHDGCPEREIFEFVEKYPDCVIISDEVGNGIVPIEAFEREYRERTGRILVELAKKAEEVERVICGIGQKIK
ncbi:MAG: bifunctional adenosylcobinamide kinase/adenosylcobinamide-phosphate guanylyltransferase [Lachnospiraceae bacterium]|nr:bifunctional adenosylcobinamide kinase/adenosylcobinamide-phosphate guanylyltransferase [Lachnospiraceae bacterium]